MMRTWLKDKAGTTGSPARGQRRGASIIEILLAVAIFGALAAGLLVFVWEPMTASGSASEWNRAVFLAEEGLEAARSIRSGGWTHLTEGPHGIAKPGGVWQFSGTSDTSDGFTRVVTVGMVERDANGNIVDSGGLPDPRTKLVTSTVSWGSLFGGTKSLDFSAYITNWNVYDWKQTSDSHFYGGTLDHVTVVGTGDDAHLELETMMMEKYWIPSQGILVTHTSDTDWSGGTYTDTILNETGEPANITGTGDPEWVELAAGKSIFETTDQDFIDGTFSDTVVAGTGDLGAVALDTHVAWFEVSSPSLSHMNGVAMYSSIAGFAVGGSGDILEWDGYEWSEALSPTGNALYDISMASDTTGFAVGGNGSIISWNGTVWSSSASPTGNTLYGVYQISSTDAWAVGASGTILHWDGSTWMLHTDTGNHTWRDIHMVSATDGWAVSASGVIYRWNGTGWSNVASPTAKALYSVSFSSPTLGFAVGTQGTIIKWDGTSWTVAASPTADALNGIHMISDLNGWAVGSGGALVHWDGTSWSNHTAPSSDQMNAIFFLTPSEGFAVGNTGVIWRYGGGYKPYGTYISASLDAGETVDWGHAYWSEDLRPDTDLTVAFRGGNTSSPNPAWTDWSAEFTDPFDTNIPLPDTRYIQYRVTLTSSNMEYTPRLEAISISYNEPSPEIYYGVAANDANTDAWAVGSGGALARYDGSNWSDYPSPVTDTLLDIDFYDDTHVWVVGDNGTVIFWDGMTWTVQTTPTNRTLYGVEAVSPTSVYAVGQAGTALHFDGVSWTLQTVPDNKDLLEISMLSDSYGVAVGRRGLIVAWDGMSWSIQSSGTTAPLNGVDALATDFAVAVGQSGVTLHWDGVSWTQEPSGTNNELNAVFCLATDDCWAVGVQQTFLHWDGMIWSEYVFNNPSNPIIQDIYMHTYDSGWSVGESGSFVHYTPYIPSPAYYVSSVVDSGTASAVWNTVSWDSVLPLYTGMSVATRTGPTPIPDGSWSAWSSELSDSGGSTILSPSGRYLQYRVTYTNSDPSSTAVLNSIRLIHGAVTAQDLYGIEGTSISDVWSVGRVGTIIHYDGTDWNAVSSPTTRNLNDVDAVSNVLAFAVGSKGTIVEWDGVGWSTVSSGTNNELNSVSMVDASFGAAVGAGGTILHWNGSSWSSVASPTANDLKDVYLISATEGFAVGVSGTILEWDGVGWSVMTSPVSVTLNGVHALSSSHGWAVGDSGTILFWDGVSWSSFTSPTVSRLYAVESRSVSEAWAVGDFGVIIEYDGTSWSSFASPVSRNLYDLTVYNPTDGWICGALGTILKDPPPYYPTGTFTSSVLDTDLTATIFDTVFWTPTLPVGTSVSLYTRSGATPTPDGTWSAFSPAMTVDSGTAIPSPGARYIQFMAVLSTGDDMYTPQLNDVTITYSQ